MFQQYSIMKRKNKIYELGKTLGLDKKDIDNVLSPKEIYKAGTIYGTVSPKEIYKAGTIYGTVSPKDLL